MSIHQRRYVRRAVPIAAAVSGIAAVLAFAPSATSAYPGRIGPPWIAIEYPVNPFDRSTRGAHLLVHAYHHGTPMAHPVSGTAEGIVGGQRRTITLRFETTSRTGVYALHKQWPSEGSWTLVIAVTQGEGGNDGAYAIVELTPSGSVASIDVPTRQHGAYTVPRRPTAQEIEGALRAQAQRVGLAGRSRS